MEHSGSRLLAPSIDGRLVLAGSASLGLWDISTGKRVTVVKKERDSALSAIALSANKRLALVGGARAVERPMPQTLQGIFQVWDTTKSQVVYDLIGHRGTVYGVAFSPDSKFALSASVDFDNFVTGANKQTIKLWDLQNKGNLIRSHELRDGFLQVGFSQDGKSVYSLGQRSRFWDVKTGALVRQIEKPPHKGRILGFSRDQRFSLTQEGPGEGNPDMSLGLWELATARALKTLKRRNDGREILKIDFAPSGKLVALAGSDDLLEVWNLDNGTLAVTLKIPVELRIPRYLKK